MTDQFAVTLHYDRSINKGLTDEMLIEVLSKIRMRGPYTGERGELTLLKSHFPTP